MLADEYALQKLALQYIQTALIAAVALWIAFQQYRLSRDKRKHEKLGDRMSEYTSLMKAWLELSNADIGERLPKLEEFTLRAARWQKMCGVINIECLRLAIQNAEELIGLESYAANDPTAGGQQRDRHAALMEQLARLRGRAVVEFQPYVTEIDPKPPKTIRG